MALRSFLGTLLIGGMIASAATPAMAGASQTYSFDCFEGCTLDTVLPGSQLMLDVADAGSAVQFTFSNALGSQSTIAQIYFDTGMTSLFSAGGFGISGYSNGVNFAAGAQPTDPPGGKNIDFSSDFSFTRLNKGGLGNGIDAGEYLTLQATLNSGKTYQDVIKALNTGGLDELRIALHVQSIPNGFLPGTASAGFITAVPEPETWSMLGAGLGLIALRLRRKTATSGRIS